MSVPLRYFFRLFGAALATRSRTSCASSRAMKLDKLRSSAAASFWSCALISLGTTKQICALPSAIMPCLLMGAREGLRAFFLGNFNNELA